MMVLKVWYIFYFIKMYTLNMCSYGFKFSIGNGRVLYDIFVHLIMLVLQVSLGGTSIIPSYNYSKWQGYNFNREYLHGLPYLPLICITSHNLGKFTSFIMKAVMLFHSISPSSAYHLIYKRDDSYLQKLGFFNICHLCQEICIS